ncbi:family 76 glycosyl hydrolase [Plectosphaerella plurivora]|uniref:Mannan endo-1,6-alpha-mannosidase n=1 Tax=Plectosphaerella plurivora TaxID=936078 RepID=A0A9P8VKH5_9PEZI|nr:family 76 glycosyl hydrolase [Plectosphaerella plurivora]
MMVRSFASSAGTVPMSLFLLAVALPPATAQVYKISDRNAIVTSAQTLAFDLMTYYDGNETGEIPGMLPGPPFDGLGDYYWYQAAGFWATFIDYWRVTGDDMYNDVVAQGLLHQVGENNDFAPANQTATLSNDDQCNWGVASMLAAESRFPSPAGAPEWLAVAQNVFERLAWRLDQEDGGECGGGLRWSIPPENAGYNYKPTTATGCFFNLAARLARHTGNEMYAKYADKSWDWMYNIGYIDNTTWSVYEGSHAELNCSDINRTTFSVDISSLTQGAAFMYNHTQSDAWRNRTSNLVDRFLADFVVEDNGAFFEVPCEGVVGRCTVEMLGFKGLAHRYLASSIQVAPFLRQEVLPALRASAQKAIDQCTGGVSERQCGFYWSRGRFISPDLDQTTGLSEQMNVLSAVSSLLIPAADAPAFQTSIDSTEGSGNGEEIGDDSNSDGNGEADNRTPGSGSGASFHGVNLFVVAGVLVVWGVMAWY